MVIRSCAQAVSGDLGLNGGIQRYLGILLVFYNTLLREAGWHLDKFNTNRYGESCRGALFWTVQDLRFELLLCKLLASNATNA